MELRNKVAKVLYTLSLALDNSPTLLRAEAEVKMLGLEAKVNELQRLVADRDKWIRVERDNIRLMSDKISSATQDSQARLDRLKELGQQLAEKEACLSVALQEVKTLQSKNLEQYYTIQELHTMLEEARLGQPAPSECMALPSRPILSMPFKLGRVTGTIYGGPYRGRPEDLLGVKMAEEIAEPCVIDVPTIDFGVPNPETLRLGLLQAVLLLRQHKEIYVGCMGGIGRTGIFMAGLAKMMKVAGHIDMQDIIKDLKPSRVKTPLEVMYVRKFYKPHAVETEQQMQYIRDLQVQDLVDTLKLGEVI